LAVEVREPVPEAAAPEWAGIERLLLMGTEIGIKGVDVDPHVYDRVRRAVAIRDTLAHRPEVFVDGGIRQHTVPLMAAAGADGVIPGSLIYAVENPLVSIAWLHSLPAPGPPRRPRRRRTARSRGQAARSSRTG
jgi:ribulose-phosphate 3-epimerase